MPDAIDRWENEGGAIAPLLASGVAPEGVGGAFPGRAAPARDMGPDTPAGLPSGSTSDTVDGPRIRRGPAEPR